MPSLFLGIDVGTASVRVGAFDATGKIYAKGAHPIQMWRPRPGFVEQSSSDIWEATGKAMRQCLQTGRIEPTAVKGIAFDATCSLVALGKDLTPLSVSPDRNSRRNVIVWMDHRAIDQANRINRTGHEVLQFVGGKISPEMEPPKLMWIKENLPQTWREVHKFMDLADYMVFCATRQDRRSLCTTVCKWTYLGHGETPGYRQDFFKMIGLEDLFEKDRVPAEAYPIGGSAGPLSGDAARELGLPEGIAVGIGIIDAHVGGIGTLGALLNEGHPKAHFEKTLALIGGTSSCHMAVSTEARYIKGVWGPYMGAMLPDMWLNEGGQSATGSLIDMVIHSHPGFGEIQQEARNADINAYAYLNRRVMDLKKTRGLEVTRDLHMLPYHHGNRSPRADPTARGMLSGLSLDQSVDQAAQLYYSTLQAIAYGTRHIIEAMNHKGYRIDRIHFCGGHLKNDLFLQEHADITGCDVILPQEPEAVLLGAAILGAVAAGEFGDIFSAMGAMCRAGKTIRPDASTASFHDLKYEIFKDMYAFQKQMKTKMMGRRSPE